MIERSKWSFILSYHLIFSEQVMKKLNIELAYARSDLNDALYKGVGDINAARKRVIWLEDKMGELCGKKRLKVKYIDKKKRYEICFSNKGEYFDMHCVQFVYMTSVKSNQRKF